MSTKSHFLHSYLTLSLTIWVTSVINAANDFTKIYELWKKDIKGNGTATWWVTIRGGFGLIMSSTKSQQNSSLMICNICY